MNNLRLTIFFFFLVLVFNLFSQEKRGLEQVLQKEYVNILDIGNSYTVNATQYLNDLLEAALPDKEYKHSLYIAYRGSGSFKDWYEMYKNCNVASEYYIKRISGKCIDEIAPFDIIHVEKEETDTAIDNWVYMKTLVYSGVKWDIIIIHQVSDFAHDCDLWNTNSDAGYLNELIAALRETNPQAVIGTYIIHSYRSGYSNGLVTYENSFERWKEYADAVKKMLYEYDIDFVIPYGTAVQNLRTAYPKYTHEFSYDGTHLSRGLGLYVAGCCYFQSIFAPMYGVDVLGNTFRPAVDISSEYEVAVDESNAVMAQKAAVLAVKDMYMVNNPQDFSIIDCSGDYNVIYDIYGRVVECPQKGVYIVNGKKVLVK